MKTKPTLFASLALLTLLATAAVAQPGPRGDRHPHGPDGFGPEMRVERLARILDLTEEQQQAITAIQDEAQKAGRELRKEMARLQNQRQGEMLKDAPSEKAVLELTEKMGAVRTKLEVNRMKTRLAVRAQLTEDQQDMLQTMRHRKGGRGRGGCDGSGPCGDDDGGRGERGRRGQGNQR